MLPAPVRLLCGSSVADQNPFRPRGASAGTAAVRHPGCGSAWRGGVAHRLTERVAPWQRSRGNGVGGALAAMWRIGCGRPFAQSCMHDTGVLSRSGKGNGLAYTPLLRHTNNFAPHDKCAMSRATPDDLASPSRSGMRFQRTSRVGGGADGQPAPAGLHEPVATQPFGVP